MSLIGPGFFLYIDDLLLDPGEKDGVLFGLSNDLFGLDYLTGYAESPALTLGMETDAADYAFTVQATEIIGAEDSLFVFANLTDNTFSVDASDNTAPLTLDLYLERFDDDGEHVFGATGFVLAARSTAYLSYEDWDEDAGVLTVYVDRNGDGDAEETVELPDESDEFEWGEE